MTSAMAPKRALTVGMISHSEPSLKMPKITPPSGPSSKQIVATVPTYWALRGLERII
jgi:hypothetical protein